MKAGDRIRIIYYVVGRSVGYDDYIVEKFRHCLGIFKSEQHRQAQYFTPLCELYEPGADSKVDYISNFGGYKTDQVQGWCDMPALTQEDNP